MAAHSRWKNGFLLVEWSASETVTLRLAGRQRCTFLREEEREVESTSKVVKESTIFGKSEQKVVTRVNEWFWKIDVEWELVAYAGTMGGPRQLRTRCPLDPAADLHH